MLKFLKRKPQFTPNQAIDYVNSVQSSVDKATGVTYWTFKQNQWFLTVEIESGLHYDVWLEANGLLYGEN